MSLTSESVVIVGAGQSGLAGARAALDAGLRPLVLEAGERTVGSWPLYYDSLTLFSPARFSGFPGMPIGGDPDRYPVRDEVAEHLDKCGASLDAEIRTGTTVAGVTQSRDGLDVHLAGGETVQAAAVIAASGSFGNPLVPVIPGQESFGGEALHVADYRSAQPYEGRRVVVVGGGNSAVQVAYELAAVADVTLATRAPVQFLPQVRGGRDIHFWLDWLRLDLLPPAVLARLFSGTPVLDTGIYQAAIESGELPRSDMFTAYDADGVVWPGGEHKPVDAVLFATGYRPHLPYLRDLGALTADGLPLHRRGMSTTHPRLAYLGVEFQRSFSSNTLRGVHRDARFVMRALARQLRRG
ncbi:MULTISPECIES: flavin-containing monooxygenase [Kribbella]|uniref:ArsO family NAD(P)H-dependent flavin-containing monooxygenase n=1 Tax=Kribbella sancticallisti TaxID=460087 RepID=A0ABP4QEN3_9ACTN|nr:NAD(P)/FAD-dependent oxidoreductase [Kribbella catacumbae]